MALEVMKKFCERTGMEFVEIKKDLDLTKENLDQERLVAFKYNKFYYKVYYKNVVGAIDNRCTVVEALNELKAMIEESKKDAKECGICCETRISFASCAQCKNEMCSRCLVSGMVAKHGKFVISQLVDKYGISITYGNKEELLGDEILEMFSELQVTCPYCRKSVKWGKITVH